jgi:hypothetical protein
LYPTKSGLEEPKSSQVGLDSRPEKTVKSNSSEPQSLDKSFNNPMRKNDYYANSYKEVVPEVNRTQVFKEEPNMKTSADTSNTEKSIPKTFDKNYSTNQKFQPENSGITSISKRENPQNTQARSFYEDDSVNTAEKIMESDSFKVDSESYPKKKMNNIPNVPEVPKSFIEGGNPNVSHSKGNKFRD